ncbi:UNVERIFIED_CONTAM: hypothetical protein Sindi_2643900, partial [Sesamum indicum]
MASNTQQFGVRHDDPPRKSNEEDSPDNNSGDMTLSPKHTTRMEGLPEFELRHRVASSPQTTSANSNTPPKTRRALAQHTDRNSNSNSNNNNNSKQGA